VTRFSGALKGRYPSLDYARVEQLLERAQVAKVPVYRDADVSPVAKVPYKTRAFFQVALRRNMELTTCFVHSFNNELFVPLFVTARAVVETGCLARDLWGRVERILKARDRAALKDFDEYVKKVLLGAKSTAWVGDPSKYQAPNVLTIIDRLTKAELPNLRDSYDGLSEVAHPNFSGMLAAYFRFTESDAETRFVDRPFHEMAGGLDFPVNAVAAGLLLTVEGAESYEKDLVTFTRLCEEEIHDSGTWPHDIPYPRA
jgi:hypothetical protein